MKEKIELLRKELHQHNYNYYVSSSPTISDYEFDMKLKSTLFTGAPRITRGFQ